jgi:hypothetical protein
MIYMTSKEPRIILYLHLAPNSENENLKTTFTRTFIKPNWGVHPPFRVHGEEALLKRGGGAMLKSHHEVRQVQEILKLDNSKN